MKRLFFLALLFVAGTLTSAQPLPESPKPQFLRASATPAGVPELKLFGAVPDLNLASELPPSFLLGDPADMPEPATLRPVIARPPEAPRFHKKIFIAEVVAYTVPNILDGVTTVRGVRRGFTEAPYPRGSAELLGSRPGIARYTLVMGGMQVAVTYASYKLQHSRSRMLRMFGHTLMAKGMFDHTAGFVNNLRLGPHP